MTSNPLALQLYTVRDELASGRAAVLKAIRDFGYGAVEPYDVRTDPEALRADLDAAGLAVCSVHARALGEDAGPLLDGARTVGADTVIVPSVPAERFADSAAIAALAVSPGSDLIQVQRLKKRKLVLRDKIRIIEDQLTPDIIA